MYVVRSAGSPTLWALSWPKILRDNLVCGRVKFVDNDFAKEL